MDWEARWAAGDTGWDHGEASPPLAAYVAAHAMTGRAIVPGCGSGHDVRLLARHGLEVVGVDVAPTAVARARSYPAVGRERYQEADWFRLPVSFGGAFDWLVEHTCLCALPPDRRRDYAEVAHFVLRPGGHFLGVFYLDPASPGGPPFGISPEQLNELFAAFRLVARWRPSQAYPSREGREEMRLYRK